MSLNARINLGASLILAIFLVLTGLALDRAFHESARSARQDRLLGQLYLLIGAAEVDRHGELAMPAVLPESRLSQPGSGLYAHITDAGGKEIWHSTSAVGSMHRSGPLWRRAPNYSRRDATRREKSISCTAWAWSGPREANVTPSPSASART